MRTFYSLLSLAVAVFSVGQATAQEPAEAQIEFIQKLRGKGYNDLALQHIDKLKADGDSSSFLPIERARTLVALAREKEAEQRPALFAAARAELEAFVQKNPTGPEAAQGRLEIARLAAYSGQALLNRALREDDVPTVRRAEQQFMQAGRELTEAIKALDVLKSSFTGPDKEKTDQIRQQLGQDLLQARLDRASNFIDQALTYIDTSSDADNRKRAEVIDQAKQAFKFIALDGGPVGLLASAWLVKVNQEGQDPTEADKHRKRVMAESGKAAQPAQLMARMFYIQGIMKNPTLKLDPLKKSKLIEDEAKKWLTAYPGHLKTPEGLAVRFELAQAMYTEAQAATKDGKPPTPAVMAIYNQAQKHFAAVAESESNLAERAKGYSVSISVMKLGEKTATADLKDFESCYLKAQVEIFKVREIAGKLAGAAPKEQENLEADRQKHLRESIKALARAVMLADAKTPHQNLDEARWLLATGHMLAGDLHRAAVAGDAMARAKPPTKRSAQAAAYAIEAYANILQRDGVDSNRHHLKDLAEYVLRPEMQKSWAAEPVTGVARYQLAMLLSRDNAYKEAIDHLEKLPPDFHGYAYAQGQLVFIAQDARDKANTEDERKVFADVARKAIVRSSQLPDNADATTAAMYFFAHLEMPKLIDADARAALAKNDLPKAQQHFQDMNSFLVTLKGKLDKTPIKLSTDTRAKLDFSMAWTAKYAKLGLADLEYRKGNYDLVLQATGDIVAAVAKQAGDGKAPIRLKDYQVIGDLLGLALRANVQKGNTAPAKTILGYLDRLTGEEEGVAETANVLRTLIGDLQAQVKELKKTNNQAKLKQTVANFSAFIDDLANKKGSGLEVKDIVFLATCYSSLEEYPKAAGLYAKIPRPKTLDNVKLKEEDEKEVATFWHLQIQYAKALRLSAKSKDDLAKAKKLLDALLVHKNARLQIYAEVEQIHVLEDSAKFGTPLYGLAMKGWGGIMNNNALKAKMGDDPSLKELYFNAYFGNAWCLYKLSQTEASIAKGKDKEYLTTAANHIMRLERTANPEGWQIVGHRFRELLANETKLRNEYERLKKTAK